MSDPNLISTTVVYSEEFRPWFVPMVFFLPIFYTYGIIIQKDNKADPKSTTITFGYGYSSPSHEGVASHTTLLENIDPSSVITGEASGKDNIVTFGGWGIRLGLNGTWAYNASFSGPYIEFIEKNGTKSTKYRIASKDAEKVASLLRGSDPGSNSKETVSEK